MSAKKRKQARAKDRRTTPETTPALRRRRLPLIKKLAFALVPLLLSAVLLETGLIVAGVQPQLNLDDPFVGYSAQVPLWVECDVNGEPGLTTAPNKLKWFNQQQFLRAKPAGTYRIVTLGGSTTYGRPYSDATSFSGWLRELLPAADGTKHWEVINAGGISYASYRVLRVMEETAKFDPDLFIVYTGHNEFLEERTYRDVRKQPGWLRLLTGKLGRTRIYSAMQRMIFSDDKAPGNVADSQGKPTTELSDEVRTRLDKGVGPDAYRRDDTLASNVVEHFRYNLNRMVDVAEDCGARLIFVTPASNLADCSPFKSEPIFSAGDEAQSKRRWQATMDTARESFRAGEFQRAADLAERAVQFQPRDAASQYLFASVLKQLRRVDEARAAFAIARDEDVCPLRAPSNFIDTLCQVADQCRIPLVDFVAIVQQNSDDQIAGSSLFLDHVHPTTRGHRLLAEGLLQEMALLDIVHLGPDWSPAIVDGVAQRIEALIDRKVQADALRNLAKVMTWAGKPEDANRAALEAIRLLAGEGDAETHCLAGNAELQRGNVAAAIMSFQKSLAIDPNHVPSLNSLGAAYFQSQKRSEAIKAWKRAVELDPNLAAVHNNLGSVFQGQRDYRQAAYHFQQAIKINPRYANAHNNLGVMLRNQGRFDEAFDQFERAIAIDSNSAEAHYNLGTVFAQRGQSDQALTKFRDSLRVNPEYGPAHHQLAIQQRLAGNPQAAIESLKRALQFRAPTLEPPRLLAWILATSSDATLRNGKQALQLINQVAQSSPRSSVAILRTLAAAHAELGELDQAIDWQRKAIKLSTNETERASLEADLAELNAGRPIRD